ncbi:coiled-coil domain-containing protein 106-like [Centropristis striata]|uniref:coiled-coil domain-containing protein 106-like n=1 Tax=Centropristis striata TaxID=184440 RepID=UPI0027E0A8A3|nr:coiled-coil domain-containing protein 106-like [Centropristis striata]
MAVLQLCVFLFITAESSKMEKKMKRVFISDEESDIASVVATDSPLSDSSFEEDTKAKKKLKKRSPKLGGSPKPEMSRVRVKNIRDIIKRYKAVLKRYSEGGSMKTAFEEVGVDRNTIARTAVVAELCLAAPEAFSALDRWNDKIEKLSAFVDRCRAAVTTEIKEQINRMKEDGILLPIAH